MKTNKQPLVSVIMPVYNGSRFIGKAIQSILTQTYEPLELVVVDDGSTDATWEILKKIRIQFPQKIRIFRFKKNLGESATANFAFSKSRGAFIARMDADDVAHFTRIAKQVAFLQTHPLVIVLGTQARVIDAKGTSIGAKKSPLEHEQIYRLFGFINPMIHPSVMFRRSLLPKGPLYTSPKSFETTDDYHTYFHLLNYGSFANLPEALVSYRIHGANKSFINMKEKFWTDTKVRLTAITHYNYRPSLFMFPAIIAQAAIVSLLPESLVKEIFYHVRGLKQFTFRVPAVHIHTSLGKVIRYALFLQ